MAYYLTRTVGRMPAEYIGGTAYRTTGRIVSGCHEVVADGPRVTYETRALAELAAAEQQRADNARCDGDRTMRRIEICEI